MAPHNHPFPFMKDHPSSSSSSLGQNNTTTSKGKEKETPYDAFPSSSYQVEPLEHSKIEHNLSNPPWSQIQMNSTMQEQETPYYAFPSSSYQVEPLDHTKVDHNSSNLPQGQIQMNSNEKKMLTNRVVSGQNQNHTMQVQGNPSVFYYAFLANNYGVGPLASPPQSQNQMNSRAVSESLGQNENHTRPEQETTNYARLPSNNNMVNQYMQSYSEVEWLRDPLEGLSLSNPNPMPMRRVNSELNTLTIRPNRFLYSPPIGNNGTLGFGQQYSPPNVENYRGQLVSMAKHLDGCRLLQNMIDRGNPIELDTIFLELKDHLYDLMMHPLGTKVIQKFLQPNRLFTRHVHCILDLITEDAHQHIIIHLGILYEGKSWKDNDHEISAKKGLFSALSFTNRVSTCCFANKLKCLSITGPIFAVEMADGALAGLDNGEEVFLRGELRVFAVAERHPTGALLRHLLHLLQLRSLRASRSSAPSRSRAAISESILSSTASATVRTCF